VSDISLVDFLDPRGRVNRKGLAVLAAVLLGAQGGVYAAEYGGGLSVPSGMDLAINAILMWLGIAAISKRMHDLDIGLPRIVTFAVMLAFAAVVAAVASIHNLGEDAMMPGQIGYLLVAAVVFGPALAATVWLHFAPGSDTANRFGPAPGPSGFSRQYSSAMPAPAAPRTGAIAFS
jgi:uncharacterized membrane protein YhaH (DUF805 family)